MTKKRRLPGSPRPESKADVARRIKDECTAEAIRMIAAGATYKEAAAKLGKEVATLKGWCAGKVRVTPEAIRRIHMIPSEMKVRPSRTR